MTRITILLTAPLLLGMATADDWPPPALSAHVVAVTADTVAPRRQEDLRAGCRRPDGEGVITFVNGSDGRPLLAAFSPRKLADPRRDIWLRPRFTSSRDRGRASGSQDWAYVYDGNGDGRIDHIAYLIGPLPIRTGAAGEPPVIPIIDGKLQGGMAADAMMAFLARLRFGFWQLTDSDGDGTPDAAAWPAERREDGWYRGWAVQQLGGGGCRVIAADGQPEMACAPGPSGRDLVADGVSAHQWAPDPAAIFARIRAAGVACNFAPGSLRPLP